MKMIVSVVASLLIPGLGQLFHGKIIAGAILFCTALVIGPVVNLVAGAHCLFLSGK